jgi:hypothetical protein
MGPAVWNLKPGVPTIIGVEGGADLLERSS